MKDNSMKIKNKNNDEEDKTSDTKNLSEDKTSDTKNLSEDKTSDTKSSETKSSSNNSTKIELVNNKYQSNIINKNKRQVLKPGRTILIKIVDNISVFTDDLTENLSGLINKTVIANNKTIFLTFDTIDNSYNAYNFLRFKSNRKYIVNFSYYKLFFIIKGLKDDSNYNESKNKIIEFITKNTDINILYFKFYCKDNKYIGCGDLTVDTIDGLNKIINNSELKNFTIDKDITGVFYKYNKKVNI